MIFQFQDLFSIPPYSARFKPWPLLVRMLPKTAVLHVDTHILSSRVLRKRHRHSASPVHKDSHTPSITREVLPLYRLNGRTQPGSKAL